MEFEEGEVESFSFGNGIRCLDGPRTDMTGKLEKYRSNRHDWKVGSVYITRGVEPM